MKRYIIVILPKYKKYKIIYEKDFIHNNQYITECEIIKVLKLLGLKYEKDFICDSCVYKGDEINDSRRIS